MCLFEGSSWIANIPINSGEELKFSNLSFDTRFSEVNRKNGPKGKDPKGEKGKKGPKAKKGFNNPVIRMKKNKFFLPKPKVKGVVGSTPRTWLKFKGHRKMIRKYHNYPGGWVIGRNPDSRFQKVLQMKANARYRTLIRKRNRFDKREKTS